MEDDDHADLRVRPGRHERVHPTSAEAEDGQPLEIGLGDRSEEGHRSLQIGVHGPVRRVDPAHLPAVHQGDVAPLGESAGNLRVPVVGSRHAPEDQHDRMRPLAIRGGQIRRDVRHPIPARERHRLQPHAHDRPPACVMHRPMCSRAPTHASLGASDRSTADEAANAIPTFSRLLCGTRTPVAGRGHQGVRNSHERSRYPFSPLSRTPSTIRRLATRKTIRSGSALSVAPAMIGP